LLIAEILVMMDIVEENLNKPWNLRYLSCNPSITLEFVEANLDKPWDH
jgi:hypothetical protein